jgi:hypothetical protein
MDALKMAVIYVTPFLLIGIVTRIVVGRWMRQDVDLSEIQSQAGPNRRKRKLFLLGIWRTED